MIKVVEKALNMAKLMNIPVLGLVENMSYIKCPDCGKEISVFGESHIMEVAQKHSLPLLARIPIDTKLAKGCDNGTIELFGGEYVDQIVPVLDAMIK